MQLLRQRQQSLMKVGCTLLFDDVVLDEQTWSVRWALKRSKGDPFGKRKGKDGKDWTVTAGSRQPSHPIDIFRLTRLYIELMSGHNQSNKCNRKHNCNSIGKLNKSHLIGRQTKLSPSPATANPFFQTLDGNGSPTGKPLGYRALLNELKRDLGAISDVHTELEETAVNFGLHCFRRFGATLCKAGGLPNDITQYLGRWCSDCFQRYWIFSDEDKLDMSRQMIAAI